MEVRSALKGRRSIRKYKNKEIDKETLIKVPGGAMYAPSVVNKQPWHFLVIAIGDPDQECPTPERFKPGRISFNSWGKR